MFTIMCHVGHSAAKPQKKGTRIPATERSKASGTWAQGRWRGPGFRRPLRGLNRRSAGDRPRAGPASASRDSVTALGVGDAPGEAGMGGPSAEVPASPGEAGGGYASVLAGGGSSGRKEGAKRLGDWPCLLLLESHVLPPKPAALVPPPLRALLSVHEDQLPALPLTPARVFWAEEHRRSKTGSLGPALSRGEQPEPESPACAGGLPSRALRTRGRAGQRVVPTSASSSGERHPTAAPGQ